MARFWKRLEPGADTAAKPTEKLSDENSLEDHLLELESDVRAKHREETDFFKRKITGGITPVKPPADSEAGRV